jgi:hypothetical protein
LTCKENPRKSPKDKFKPGYKKTGSIASGFFI